MNWPTLCVTFVLAVTSVVALSQRPSLKSVKGRGVTLRACVEQALFNAVRLSQLTDVTAASAPMPATRVLYWFYKAAEFKDRVGQQIEINASVKEATEGELELTVNDGIVAEVETSPTSAPVATTSNVPLEKPTAPSGNSDVRETITLKMDVSGVRLLSTGCGSRP
jgi:hypothetical protein